jgi:hypothetical protein
MKIKKFFLPVVAACLLIFIVFEQLQNIKMLYLTVFRRDGQIFHYNKYGKFEGKAIIYSKGNIVSVGNFVNGLREGLVTQYFQNGQIKNQSFYRHDKIEGIENEYYSDGKLNYKANWKNNKYYGSEWHWLENGNIAIYNTSDIIDMFYYSEYDSLGKLNKIIGHLVSPNVFSEMIPIDSVVLLADKTHYHSINSLYINVATPPNLNPVINIDINKLPFKSFKISENTISIKNVFPSAGSYIINIKGKLIDRNNRIIRKDSLNLTIIKD